MGAALTYARRYALFALVGIAGEDDLDAPDAFAGPPPAEPRPGNGWKAKQDKSVLRRPPVLSREESAKLRDQMLTEIVSLKAEEDFLAWAKNGLPRKNTLLEADARTIEDAYQQRLGETALPAAAIAEDSSQVEASVHGASEGNGGSCLSQGAGPQAKQGAPFVRARAAMSDLPTNPIGPTPPEVRPTSAP